MHVLLLAFAIIVTASPGDNLQSKINSLQPGDELVLSAGTYAVNNLTFSGRVGSPSAWFTVRAAAGATVVLSNPGGQNMFNISGSQYVRLAGLVITGGTSGEDGVKCTGTNSDITVEDCTIHDVGGLGIFCGAITRLDRLTVRRCHIYRTGPSGTGEAMYLGQNSGSAPVLNCLIEGNWIHDTRGSQGDGIELNQGGLGNVIRDNVVYNTPYPCILVENTQAGAPNVVERNVCWNSGDNTIQVNGNAIVRNNIAQTGASSALHVGPSTGLEVYNNVLYSAGTAVYFSGGVSLKFANNIVDGGVGQIPNGTVTNNYWKSAGFGTNLVAGAPGYNAAAMDFYPRNLSYVDAGWSGSFNVPADDFNDTARTGLPDIGAYEITGSTNPGWAIGPGMKGSVGTAPPPPNPSAASSSSGGDRQCGCGPLNLGGSPWTALLVAYLLRLIALRGVRNPAARLLDLRRRIPPIGATQGSRGGRRLPGLSGFEAATPASAKLSVRSSA